MFFETYKKAKSHLNSCNFVPEIKRLHKIVKCKKTLFDGKNFKTEYGYTVVFLPKGQKI